MIEIGPNLIAFLHEHGQLLMVLVFYIVLMLGTRQ